MDKTRYNEHHCIIGTMTWEPLPLLMCHQLQGHWILNGTVICLLGDFDKIGLHVQSCITKTNASYNDIYLIRYSSLGTLRNKCGIGSTKGKN
jgi:hypothetical protein